MAVRLTRTAIVREVRTLRIGRRVVVAVAVIALRVVAALMARALWVAVVRAVSVGTWWLAMTALLV